MYREKGEMQHFPKEKVVLALVVLSLILFAFLFLGTTNTIVNISAVEASGVGVYWDSDCTDEVSEIDWGTLTPGSLKSIVVYVRNEVEEPTYLILRTANWNPSEASQYLNLGCKYFGQRMNPNETLQITLTLSVSRHIEGISSFSFDIIITGSDSLPGDVNVDGKVGLADLVKLKLIYSGWIPGPPYIDPTTGKHLMPDVNGDGKVGLADIVKLKIIYSGIL